MFIANETTEHLRPHDYMLGVISFLFLAGLCPLAFVRWQDSEASTLNIILGYTVVLISSARLAQAIGTGRVNVLVITFHVFVYVFLGIASLAQLVVGVYPLDELSYPQWVVTKGLVVILLGVIAYETGQLLGPRRRHVTISAVRHVKWSFSQQWVRALGIFGLVMVALVVGSAGLLPFFDSRDAAGFAIIGADPGGPQPYRLEDKSLSTLSTRAVKVPVFIALFATLFMRHHRLWQNMTALGRSADRTLLAALIVANVVVNNPISNPRAWFGMIAISLVSIYVPFSKIQGKRLLAVGNLVILLFAFTSLDAFRRTGGATFDPLGPQTSIVSDESYSAFQTTLNGIRYIERVGHTNGMQMLSAFLGFVPRAVWEEKANDTGSLIDPKYNRSSTLWTEGQVDFGLPGVVILFLLYGFGSARLEATCRGGGGALLASLPIFAGLQIFLLRGALLPVMGLLYPLAAAIVLVLTRRAAKQQCHVA